MWIQERKSLTTSTSFPFLATCYKLLSLTPTPYSCSFFSSPPTKRNSSLFCRLILNSRRQCVYIFSIFRTLASRHFITLNISLYILYMSMCRYLSVCLSVSLYIYIYMCVCMCVYVCVVIGSLFMCVPLCVCVFMSPVCSGSLFRITVKIHFSHLYSNDDKNCKTNFIIKYHKKGKQVVKLTNQLANQSVRFLYMNQVIISK